MSDFLIGLCLLFPRISLGIFILSLSVVLILHTIFYIKNNID